MVRRNDNYDYLRDYNLRDYLRELRKYDFIS